MTKRLNPLVIRRAAAAALAGAIALGLSACGEVDQAAKTQKVYAGKKDARAYDGSNFGGDSKKWETALAERSKAQNEYLRTDQKK
jgi:hypothetical protein